MTRNLLGFENPQCFRDKSFVHVTRLSSVYFFLIRANFYLVYVVNDI